MAAVPSDRSVRVLAGLAAAALVAGVVGGARPPAGGASPAQAPRTRRRTAPRSSGRQGFSTKSTNPCTRYSAMTDSLA